MDSDSSDSKMLPRHYQEEVFNRARDGNIIAALDTGAGKTFIALLLIKSVAVTPGRKIVFLVNKVALVEQQGEFIASNSTLRVLKLHGEVDLADRRGWKKKYENNDVFVMTAQIFLNLITHSLWGIDRLRTALMIFDECHHTQKNHPYRGIMREYFAVPSELRPKIFGMTASPIWNVKDPTKSITELEANLDSKIVAVRDHLHELAAHAPKPSELIKQYSSSPNHYDFPSPTLWTCLNVFKSAFGALNMNYEELERRYITTLENLGPYCASMYLHFEFIQHMVETAPEPTLPKDPSMDHFGAEVLQIQYVLAEYTDFLTPRISFPVSLEWCSPKLRVLIEIVLTHYSPTFQGIIFVEQRQIAVCLSRLLPHLPALGGLIRCASLVGQGSMHDTVQAFRDRSLNLLVATSVAEEGLDFPACDLVIRFDGLQHMVQYVQSRGRARNSASTFIVMFEENDTAQLARYQTFLEKDPELKAIYQSRQEDTEVDVDDEDDDIHPTDLDERERYVVPATGAVLTYDSAIPLLFRLCALIPCDEFTPHHAPKYSGDFQATLRLPSSLPLSRDDLRFCGPRKMTKKEAKRAVAFMAVKRLHELDVFDQYLLPVSSARKGEEDSDGTPLLDVSQVPNVMTVAVKDPFWTVERHKLWIHPIHVGSRPVAGLVTGTDLPPVELTVEGSPVRTQTGELVVFHDQQEFEQMDQFTKICIWYCINGTPITAPLSLFIVPITPLGQPDFCAIKSLLDTFPRGNSNWDNVKDTDCGHLLVFNFNLIGRLYLLEKFRRDLSPASPPPDDSPEAGFQSYHDFWTQKWKRSEGKGAAYIPEDGPLLELSFLPRSTRSGKYPLNCNTLSPAASTRAPAAHVLFPQGCCRWISLSEEVREALDILPALCRRITDIYRVRRARLTLSLPPVADDILVEALTLPCSAAGYSNQRLETLGDAVLQLCTTVHIFNRYPNRHEGQLSKIRQNCVSNRFLLSRAKEIGLEEFLTCENPTQREGRYISLPSDDESDIPARCVSRQFPRRSLQDCMEATLGASFVTGGIDMALHAGRALGLDFGGPTPWTIRYRTPERSPVSSMFTALEDSLGYTFRSGQLLAEALTHASFDDLTSSTYERLEFLGDAILDLVVIHYLFRKFPAATSDQLAWPRTRAICASALAFVSVRCLKLHHFLLANNVELSMRIERTVPLLRTCSGEEIVRRGWKYDPPKVLSDVFESVIGAVLVDSNYNYERTASVVEFVMEDVLSALNPSVARDPITELMHWAAKSGCLSSKKIVFKKSSPHAGRAGVSVLVHDILVVGPIESASAVVAKNLAAERALSVLMDTTGTKHLSRFCNCGEPSEKEKSAQTSTGAPVVDSCSLGDL
ncbi:hypothetical protein C8J57DRAFT_1449631 [Mycena rebaudengoi]|nr:hypothetical protein C8J57DRAFT_1449631 [Mycena rebaudengoi]